MASRSSATCALLDGTAQVVTDLLPRSLAELVADLATDHLMARLEGDLGDPAPIVPKPTTPTRRISIDHDATEKKTGRCTVL